jgi:hypothetical protein
VPNTLQFGDRRHFHVFPQERLWAYAPRPLWGIEKAKIWVIRLSDKVISTGMDMFSKKSPASLLAHRLTGSRSKVRPPMSSGIEPSAPAKMASRSWSTNTLKRGVSQVMMDVKSEPWVEGDDESLQARLKVGFPLFPNKPTNQICTSSIPP